MATALVILAAGRGTRMVSDRPKVLHRIGGLSLIGHAMVAGAAAAPERTIVVTGHGAAAVEAEVAALDPGATCVRQDSQLGTGHAVLQAAPALEGFAGDILVLYGDTPFVRGATLARVAAARTRADVVVLGFHADDPGRYGRLVTEGDSLVRIVEAADATPEEAALGLCNSGILAADAATLWRLVRCLGTDNAAGEYYLTDLPGLAVAEGLTATVVTCAETETLGINTRAELADAEAVFQRDRRNAALRAGVTLQAPETVFFAADTKLDRDVVVEPHVVFGPGVRAEAGATVRAFTHLEGCHLGRDAVVGPHARLRPGARIGDGARIGNFVEVKAARIGDGAKVNHLSYVGDATIGPAANVGAGTVTCNYDGVGKHHTRIGAGAFIGSGTMLVAPVSVGAHAMTGSGSVITQDVAPEALAIGRARQVTKPGLATRLMQRLRAVKAARKG